MSAIEKLLSDPRKQRLVEWLATPERLRQPQTQAELAREIGVDPSLLVRWKKEPAVRAAWEAEAKERAGTPERVQAVLDQLYNDALNEQNSASSRIRAAKEYLGAIQAMKPPAVADAEQRMSELSDEELEALIRGEAAKEAARRS